MRWRILLPYEYMNVFEAFANPFSGPMISGHSYIMRCIRDEFVFSSGPELNTPNIYVLCFSGIYFMRYLCYCLVYGPTVRRRQFEGEAFFYSVSGHFKEVIRFTVATKGTTDDGESSSFRWKASGKSFFEENCSESRTVTSDLPLQCSDFGHVFMCFCLFYISRSVWSVRKLIERKYFSSDSLKLIFLKNKKISNFLLFEWKIILSLWWRAWKMDSRSATSRGWNNFSINGKRSFLKHYQSLFY